MTSSGDSTARFVFISFNERQLQAIEHVHGPMLVAAGAGTGKTTVLVERIARLIRNRDARPDEILALTYTDNAAAEMAARVQNELSGTDCRGLEAATFHAYCHRLLERCGQGFRVLTEEDLWIYLRRRIRELPLEYYIRAASPGQFLDALLEFFERCHDEEVDAAAYQRYVERLRKGELPPPRVTTSRQADGMSREETVARCQEIASVFGAVEEMLAKDGLGTFGHMITRATGILRSDAAVLAKEQARARFLLIDEFQDVNVAQIELAQLLAGAERNIFAVGDPDQAIYRFRGASAAAFQEFARRFPDTRNVTLADNQRSRSAILKCAHAVIRSNPEVHCVVDGSGRRFEREPLESAREKRAREKGEEMAFVPVDVAVSESDEQEAVDVAQRIAELRQEAESHRDAGSRCPRFGILYRAHFHRDAVVKECAARGLPLSVVGINALETAEVRDLLACLRVAGNMADSGSLFRVAARPIFKVDPERLREALAQVKGDADFISILETVPGGDQVMAAVEEAWATVRMSGMGAATALEIVLQRFAFDPQSPAVLAFSKFVSDWRSKPLLKSGDLAEFLDYMDHFPEAGGTIQVPTGDNASDLETVRLMTVHAAKGLEFDHVFVLRLNAGSLPGSFRERLFEFPQKLRGGLVPEGDDKEIHRQEERRLFYVSMTRARESLTLCARPGRGRRDPRPQAFVRELMDDPAARPYWRQREPAPFTIDLAAAASPPATGVGAWMLLPPPERRRDASLSATSIESYQTCPLQFKIERDWNIPGEVAAAMQYGNAVHTLLKDYYESVRAGRPKSEEEIVECLRDSLAATRFVDPVQRDLYEKEGSKQLREFVRRRQSEPPPQVIGTERGFEIQVQGVRVRGRMDRADRISENRVAIVDYKTGKPRTQRDADKSLQLSIYALAAQEQWGCVPERLVFYNLQDNSEVVTDRGEPDLEEARERVVQVAEQIAAGHFEPTPGHHCQWCAYRSFCPVTEERLCTIQAQAAGVS